MTGVNDKKPVPGLPPAVPGDPNLPAGGLTGGAKVGAVSGSAPGAVAGTKDKYEPKGGSGSPGNVTSGTSTAFDAGMKAATSEPITVKAEGRWIYSDGAFLPAPADAPAEQVFTRATLTLRPNRLGYDLRLEGPEGAWDPYPRTLKLEQVGSHALARELLARLSPEQRSALKFLAEVEARVQPLAPDKPRLVKTPMENGERLALEMAFTEEELKAFAAVPAEMVGTWSGNSVACKRLSAELSKGADGAVQLQVRLSNDERAYTFTPSIETPGAAEMMERIQAALDRAAKKLKDPTLNAWRKELASAPGPTAPRVLEPPPAATGSNGRPAGRELEIPVEGLWVPSKGTIVPAGTSPMPEGAVPVRSLRLPLGTGTYYRDEVVSVVLASGLTASMRLDNPVAKELLAAAFKKYPESAFPGDAAIVELRGNVLLPTLPPPTAVQIGQYGTGKDTQGWIRVPVPPAEGSTDPRWVEVRLSASSSPDRELDMRLVTPGKGVSRLRDSSDGDAIRRQVITALAAVPLAQVPEGHAFRPLRTLWEAKNRPVLIEVPGRLRDLFGYAMSDEGEAAPRPGSMLAVPLSALPKDLADAVRAAATPELGGGTNGQTPVSVDAVTVSFDLDTAGSLTASNINALIDGRQVELWDLKGNQSAIMRAMVDATQGELAHASATSHPALRAYVDYLAGVQRFIGGKEPKDRAAAVVWRVAHVSDDRSRSLQREIESTYGLRQRNWLGFINEPREIPVVDAVINAAAKHHSLSPEFLYVVAIGEGMNSPLNGATRGLTTFAPPERVGGFSSLGIDFFGADADRLRRAGLLPADFKEGTHYRVTQHTNEKGEATSSADIIASPDGKTAIENSFIALAAVVADRRQTVLRSAKQLLGAERVAGFTEADINWLTYLSFNAGHGNAVKLLKRLQTETGAHPVRKYTGVDHSSSSRDANYNTALRIATWDFLTRTGVFKPTPKVAVAPNLGSDR